MTTFRTFTGALRTITGESATSVTASIGTNLPDDVALVDLDNQTVDLPRRRSLELTNGAFSIQLIDTSSTGINVLDGNLRYTVYVSYRDADGKRRDWNSGPFEIISDTDLSAVAGTGIEVDVDASAALVGSLVTQAVAPIAAEVDTVIPRAASWPLFLYGASYSTLGQAFFTAGRHWSQRLAERAVAGAVTSYGVNGRRALDVALTLLNGVPISGITGIVNSGKWPGTSARSGLVIHDALGNDVMAQAAMNGASVVVQAITGAPGTTYLNYLKQTYRAALAFMSSESRLENHTHTATNGVWTHSSAGAWASGGDICFTTNAGAWAEYAVTPAQHGPLAGVVWLILDGDIPVASTAADVSVSVDGGAGVVHSTYRAAYTGHNGTQVKGYVNAVPIPIPVDGAAHTVRITHAGTEGHFMTLDCLVVPSTDPNPILCMGIELPPTVHGAALDAGDLVLYKANLIKVTATYRQVIAEFPNAVYVPSTMTANGLWSGDGLHPNDRGQEQRAADAWGAVRAIKPRLDSRVLAQLPDTDFGVI